MLIAVSIVAGLIVVGVVIELVLRALDGNEPSENKLD